MKVYVLTEMDSEQEVTVRGVYSTRDLAADRMATLANELDKYFESTTIPYLMESDPPAKEWISISWGGETDDDHDHASVWEIAEQELDK